MKRFVQAVVVIVMVIVVTRLPTEHPNMPGWVQIPAILLVGVALWFFVDRKDLNREGDDDDEEA